MDYKEIQKQAKLLIKKWKQGKVLYPSIKRFNKDGKIAVKGIPFVKEKK